MPFGQHLSLFRPKDQNAPLPYGLIVLKDGVEPCLDIVAVHGLNGHREKTWTVDNINWLRDLLPSDIPNARILAWGYDANTHNSSPISSQYLYNHAKALVSDLCLKRKLTNTRTRPILFIAHSLGGIVVKSALIHSEAARQNALEEHRSIKLSTYGILFMGTPHQGGSEVALGESILKVASIFVNVDNKILKHLERDSEWLQQQLGQYAPISSDFVTKFAYEMFPTRIAFGKTTMVVPLASAIVPGAANAEALAIPGDHLSMVKFGSREDGGYQTVSGHLQLLAQEAPNVIRARWEEQDLTQNARHCRESSQRGTNSPQTIGLNVNWYQLRKTLNPDIAINYQSKNRLARLPSTSEWIFEADRFKRWENGEVTVPLLWIQGRPGSGKSVLAASIIDRLETRTKTPVTSRRLAVAYFYCRYDMNDPRPVHAVVRTLIDQLAHQIPAFAKTISEHLEVCGLLGQPENLLQYSCFATWEFIKKINLDSYVEDRIYWIIDGLDELPTHERRDLFTILEDALRQCRKLRITVLSRVEEDIFRGLVVRLHACCLPITPEETAHDIRAYIEHGIETWGFLGSLCVRNKALETMAKKANGAFLWVKLIIDELNAVVDLDQVEEVLSGFPEDMKEVYNRIFAKLLSGHTAHQAQLLIIILKWVLLSQRSLLLSELAAALSPLGNFTPASLKASFFRICGPLLELRGFDWHTSSVTSNLQPPTDPTVHLIHASLADYLRLSNDPSCVLSLDEIIGHQEIASFCLDYFRNATQSPLFYPVNEATLYKMGRFTLGKLAQVWSSRGPTPIDLESPTDDSYDQYYVYPFVRNKFPLLGYSQQYWFRHVHQSARTKPLSGPFTEKLLSVLTFGSSLHIFSSLRLPLSIRPENVAAELMASFSNIPSNDGWEFEYLKASLWSGVGGSEIQWPFYEIGKTTDTGIKNNHVVHEQDSSQSSRIRFRRAVHLERLGDFDGAFCSYLLAFNLHDCLNEMPDISGEQNLSGLSEARLVKLFELCSPLQLLVLGKLLQRAGRDLLLATSIEMDSSNHGLQHLEIKARLLAASGKHLDAAELYYEASCLDGERWDLKEARFSLLVKAQRYTEAAEVLRLWHRADHWCEAAWLCRREAELYKNFEIQIQTLSTYTRGIVQFPLCWELYKEATVLLTRFGYSSYAIQILEDARRQPSLHFLAAQELIKLYTQTRRNSEALSVAKALTITHRDRWDSYELLWKTALLDQPMEDISKIFEDLTRRPDARWEPFVYLAYTRLDIGLYNHAVSACEAALSIKKHDSAVWTMAKAYIVKGCPEKALDILLSGFEEYGPRGVHADALIGVQLYKSFDVGHYYVAITILSRMVENWEPLRWSLLKIKRLVAGPSNFSNIRWTSINEESLALAEFHIGNAAAAFLHKDRY